MTRTTKISGKVAIVTGGRGGIGRAIALALGEAGATVAVCDLPMRSAGVAASVPIQEELPGSRFFAVDVTDEDAVVAQFNEIYRQLGRIDILVNSAGLARRAPAVDHTLDAWHEVMKVNVTGAFLCSRTAARYMLEQGEGAIVNVASIMGLSGGGLYPNVSYQTSKGAIVNMTRALAVEWARKGIRVNAVAPTYVRTEFIKPITDDPELVGRIEAMTPLGRLAEPEDVAHAVVFLVSPGAAMITGHILPVDGGFLAQ